jgi:hypothetical protein
VTFCGFLKHDSHDAAASGPYTKNRNEANMMQSLSLLIAELEGAKHELSQFFETRNGVIEEQNENAGKVERMERGTKRLPSNRRFIAVRSPTDRATLKAFPPR